jgi:hypothetical protein
VGSWTGFVPVDTQMGVTEEDCGGPVVEKSAVIRDGLEDLVPQDDALVHQVSGILLAAS